MDVNNITKKKVLNGKFHAVRPVGRRRLRSENNRRDFSLMLRRLMGGSDIWRRTVGRGQLMWAIAPLKNNGDDDDDDDDNDNNNNNNNKKKKKTKKKKKKKKNVVT